MHRLVYLSALMTCVMAAACSSSSSGGGGGGSGGGGGGGGTAGSSTCGQPTPFEFTILGADKCKAACDIDFNYNLTLDGCVNEASIWDSTEGTCSVPVTGVGTTGNGQGTLTASGTFTCGGTEWVATYDPALPITVGTTEVKVTITVAAP